MTLYDNYEKDANAAWICFSICSVSVFVKFQYLSSFSICQIEPTYSDGNPVHADDDDDNATDDTNDDGDSDNDDDDDDDGDDEANDEADQYEEKQ